MSTCGAHVNSLSAPHMPRGALSNSATTSARAAAILAATVDDSTASDASNRAAKGDSLLKKDRACASLGRGLCIGTFRRARNFYRRFIGLSWKGSPQQRE